MVKKKCRQAQCTWASFYLSPAQKQIQSSCQAPLAHQPLLAGCPYSPLLGKGRVYDIRTEQKEGGGEELREKPNNFLSSTPPASLSSPLTAHPTLYLPEAPWVSFPLFWPPSPQWYPEAGVLLNKEYSCSLVSLGSASPSQHSTNLGQKCKIKNLQKDSQTAKLGICKRCHLHCIYIASTMYWCVPGRC